MSSALFRLTAAAAGVAAVALAARFPSTILYGAAYYEEYEPVDRLDADVEMMKSAGINVVRIGESTWGTLEPHDVEFDYSHIDRVIRAMDRAGISVIVGTPT
jgi:beta-galactosidase